MTKTNWILGDKFDERYPHLDSIKALWETKWRFPCSKNLYPFADGNLSDFETVFGTLIEKNIGDPYTDEYTEAFLPVAEARVADAEKAEAAGDEKKAIELFLRAATLYRISRFPYINSPIKTKAWNAQKKAYMKGVSKWETPMTAVDIPFHNHTSSEADTIPVYLRIPKSATPDKPVPVMLLITGLDGYRPDNTQRSDEFLQRGWGCVIAEIPGTADSPADPKDVESCDRLWTAVLDWMEKQKVFDMKQVMAWGLSCGGYYAIRIAHTHAKRIKGVVAQGAGCHLWFGEEWLERIDDHEYPFPSIKGALVPKFGYNTFDEFKTQSQEKFSLVSTGIVKMPSCRLLLVNGINDGLMPIEDSMLMMNYGKPKEARFFPDTLHMGYPPANTAVYPWLEELVSY